MSASGDTARIVNTTNAVERDDQEPGVLRSFTCPEDPIEQAHLVRLRACRDHSTLDHLGNPGQRGDVLVVDLGVGKSNGSITIGHNPAARAPTTSMPGMSPRYQESVGGDTDRVEGDLKDARIGFADADCAGVDHAGDLDTEPGSDLQHFLRG